MVGGLGVFGFAFAINSSVHSYLVLAYAGSEKAAEDVGFYYAANALGRFFGTLLSGLLYQWGGLLFSLSGSAAMLVLCWLITLALPDRVAGAGRAPGFFLPFLEGFCGYAFALRGADWALELFLPFFVGRVLDRSDISSRKIRRTRPPK